jgi:DNA-directed RNA polymerase subunit N (RpoN/RPB10)
MLPIRCFTCGKVLGNKFEKFYTYKDKEKAYKDLGIERYCCKNILLTSIDTSEFMQDYTTFPKCVTLKTKYCERIFDGR